MTTTLTTAPSIQKEAPGFNLGVSPEAQALIAARRLSELVCRSLLAYNLPEDDLLDVLQNYTIERLETLPLLRKPSTLMRELHVVEAEDGTFSVLDGLQMVRAAHLESEVIANGTLALLSNTLNAGAEFDMSPDAVIPTAA